MAKKTKDGKVDTKREKWLSKLSDEDKAHKVWRDRAKSADDAYCNYNSGTDDNQLAPDFPIFWYLSNLIIGKIYGSPPKPDIRKRHPSSPLGTTAAPVTPDAQAAPANASPQGIPMVQGGMQGGSPAPLGNPQSLGPPPAPQPSPMASGGLPQQPGQPPVGGSNPGMGLSMGPQPGMFPTDPSLGPLTPPTDQTTNDNTLAICLERCLNYTVDVTDFDRNAKQAVQDFVVAACGQSKIEMHTETDTVPVTDPMGNEIKDAETGEPLMKEIITSQEVNLRHFHWTQFRWEPSKDWKNVSWVSFDHFMTLDQIEDEFGVDIPTEGAGNGPSNDENPTVNMRPPQMDKYKGVYTVHEIWDKKKRERVWISECYPGVLEEQDDPLQLKGFFPCPPPMMANVSGRELLPSTDYWQIQFLTAQCHRLMQRVKNLTEQVKDIKFYDQSFGVLKQAQEYPDGTFVAVAQLLDRLRSVDGKADTSSIICDLDNTGKVAVLQELMNQLAQYEARIEKILGISDTQQGYSNPDATATAEKIKDAWSDIRTGQRVQSVSLFFRDVFRIMTEVIANHFTRAQIQAMSGIELTDDQVQILRSDLATAYTIDVESDSTVVADDTAQQASLTQFLQVFGQTVNQMEMGVKNGAITADIMKEVLGMVVDTFKAGRNMQQAIDTLPSTTQEIQQMQQQISQAQQQSQQLQQQNQQLQQKLQQSSDAEQARKNADTQATIQQKSVDTAAKAQKLTTDGIIDAAQASQADRQNLMDGMVTGIQ